MFKYFPVVSYDILNNGLRYTIRDFTRYAGVDSNYLDNLAIYSFYEIPDGARPDVVSNILYGTPEYHWTFFIVNDTLSGNGYAEWPLSSQEFDEYISDEYDDRYALTLSAFTSDYLVNIGGTLTFSNGSSAKLYAYNDQLNQIIIENLNGTLPTDDDTITNNGDNLDIIDVIEYRYATHHIEDENGNEIYSEFIDVSSPTPQVAISYYDWESALNEKRRKIRVIKPEYIYDFVSNYQNILNA